MGSDAAVRAEGLSKRYGDVLALDGLSLEARRGEVVGVLGPNGAGKTTLLRLVCGLLTPTAGTVHVEGIDVRADPSLARGRIGYLPEETALYEHMTVLEYLGFFAELHGLGREEGGRRCHSLAERLGLGDRRSSRISTLSKGLKRRVALARALVHDPPVLVLDEPTGGLDPVSTLEVRDLVSSLAREGRTVLLSTHLLGLAEHACHRIAVLSKGRLLACGTADEVSARLGREGSPVEVVVSCPAGAPEPRARGASVERRGGACVLTFADLEPAAKALPALRRAHTVVSIRMARRSLEDAFCERFRRRG